MTVLLEIVVFVEMVRHSSLSSPGRCGHVLGVEHILGELGHCHGVVLLAATSCLGRNQS
jgi:hypothetical protein